MSPAAASSYRLIVRDLELACTIGVHEHERRRQQRVRINLELWVAPETAARAADDLSRVVDYGTVVKRVRALVSAGPIALVETLAERITASCLADERVLRARVRVEKPDVYADAAAVGVEIDRGRDDIGGNVTEM